MLIDVLNRFAEDSGWHKVQQRATILDILKAAASEMHKEIECNRIYREVTLVVPRDKVVSIPAVVGEIRGTRAHSSEVTFDVKTMSNPRYVNSTLSYKWRNWRDLGEGALQQFPASFDTLTFEASTVEDAIIKICGQTNNANRVEETLTLDASPKDSVNIYTTNIYSISSESDRTCDITVKDSFGNVLAVLYNNQRQTRYKLIDVSQLFWGQDTSDDGTLVDVLYKLPLPELTNDTDQFPSGDDYDTAWYHRAMAVHYEAQQGRETDSAKHRAISLSLMKSIKESSEGGDNKRFQFGRNKFFNLFGRTRWCPGAITNVDATQAR